METSTSLSKTVADNEEDLPVENPNIVISITMNGKKQNVTTTKRVRVLKIKTVYLTTMLSHTLSPEELSNYVLSFEGKELDVSKRIGELELSHYNLVCEPKMKVKVFADNEEAPNVLEFVKSISVSAIVEHIVGKEKTEEYFLTERSSPVVVTTKITASLDLTCTFHLILIIFSAFFQGKDCIHYCGR